MMTQNQKPPNFDDHMCLTVPIIPPAKRQGIVHLHTYTHLSVSFQEDSLVFALTGKSKLPPFIQLETKVDKFASFLLEGLAPDQAALLSREEQQTPPSSKGQQAIYFGYYENAGNSFITFSRNKQNLFIVQRVFIVRIYNSLVVNYFQDGKYPLLPLDSLLM
ncbi:MAG: hypothetical protein OXR68_05275 [Alphaproteobacteria bacterium]|nr:hypothetical protein [Alphaproteobacteria bacterium]MDD9920015.1 hypothetical protein [Alphaproteobacteria bacterium]